MFRAEYRDTPVPLEPLLARSAVYVRKNSRERAHITQWRMPRAAF
jgi:hypothetical protein